MQEKKFSFYDKYVTEGKSPLIGEGHGRNNDQFKEEFDQAVENLKKANRIYDWYRQQAISNLPENSETNVFEVAGVEFLMVEEKCFSIKKIKEWLHKIRFLKYWGTDEIVEMNEVIEDAILNNLLKQAVTYFRRK